MSTTHLLEGDSIHFSYGERKILSGVYLQCATGKVTGLLGRNGAGKSTLLNILFGTVTAESGSVRWNSKYTRKAFCVPGLISYMPQHPCIPGHLSVKKLLGLLDISAIQRSDALALSIVAKHFNTPFSTLSTGERKLLEVILFLHSGSHFVLLDEPFSFLSPVQIEQLIPIIVKQSGQKGILLTDHRYQFVMDSSDEVLLLKNGSIRSVQGMEGLKDAGYVS